MKLSHIIALLFVLLYAFSCDSSDSVGTKSGNSPKIKDFSPKQGEPGDTLTIEGKNFSSLPSGNIVKFQGTQAAVSKAGENQLKVIIPEDLKVGQYLFSVRVGDKSVLSLDKYSVINSVNLSWQDNFNGDELDTEKWYYRYPGPRGDGYNDKSSVILKDGKLYIKAYSDSVKGKLRHYTGMIATKKKFKFGKIEARISFSNQSGTHSGFWMQSPTYGKPIGNPEKAGMEIDIVESIHNDGKAYETLHWDGYGEDHKKAQNITDPIGTNSGDFHTYVLRWTPQSYKYYIDGQLMWEYSKNVSQRSEYIILSMGIDNYPPGTWAGPIPKQGYGSLKNTKSIMKVDYVKYYSIRD